MSDPTALFNMTPLDTTVLLSHSTEQALGSAGFPNVRVIPPGIDQNRWAARPRPDRPAGAKLAALFQMRPRRGLNEAQQADQPRRRSYAAGLAEVRVQGRTREMPAAIAGVDLHVLPAQQLHGKADVPSHVLEAMAATGRRVVVTDLPQTVAVGAAATHIPAGAVLTLKDAIALLNEQDRWKAMTAAGLDLVRRHFSSERMVERSELYAELLDASRTGRAR